MPVVSDEEEEEDSEAVNIETTFGELRDHVMANVQPTHPICFQSYSLCHMMSNYKLSSFSIIMLKDICKYFLIDTEDNTTKQFSCFQRQTVYTHSEQTGRRIIVTGRARVLSYPELPRCLPTIGGGSSNSHELMRGMNL